MLCQKCGKNEATVFIDATIDGAAWKYRVCARCASREAITPGEPASSPRRSAAGPAPDAAVRRRACPRCGTSRKQITSSGRFGCGVCYDIFGESVLEPAGKSSGCSSPPLSSASCVPAQKKPSAPPRPARDNSSAQKSLEKLREDLAAAVVSEDFERAAEIRDVIRSRGNS